MSKKEIEDQIAELKQDYVRIQSDLEKMEVSGANTTSAEQALVKIENELKTLNEKLKDHRT